MAKPQPKPEFEYRLILAHHFSEQRQANTILVTLETTKRFASFRYELSVEERLLEKEIRYTILGLKAPQLDLPASGTATFVREYDHLKGKHNITVQGLDGTEDTFTLQFSAARITEIKSPKKPFVELVIR